MAVAIENRKTDVQKFERQKNTLAKKVLSIKDQNIILLLSYYIPVLLMK